MNTNRTIGVILLCVWLIVVGLLAITNFEFEASGLITGLLAIAAGIFIFAGR